MRKFWLFLTLFLILALGVGYVVLVNMDIPPPDTRVERTLPDDDFPK